VPISTISPVSAHANSLVLCTEH